MQLIHKMWALIATTAVLITAGCIPSLYPIYTEQNLVVRDQILGRWTSADKTQTWTFSKVNGKAYRLVYMDKDGRDAAFVVRLTEIGETLFMDLYPTRASENEPDFYNLHLVSTHTFYRVGLSEDALRLSFLNPQWLKQHQKENPDGLSHTRKDNSVVLTADTPLLREFVAKHLQTKGAFTNPFVLNKVSP